MKEPPLQTFVLVDLAALKEQHRAEILAEIAATNNERGLSPKEYAEAEGLKTTHVYSLIRKKLIPYHKIGALIRIYPSEVRAVTLVRALERNGEKPRC